MLSAWVQRLLEKHPGEAFPGPEDPMPPWLEKELQALPLGYRIRGVATPRDRHPYYLIEDVQRQPQLWRQVLVELDAEIEGIAARLIERGVESVVLVGCGSALYASVLGEFLFEHLAALPARAVESLEFANYPSPLRPQKSLLLAQSATGASAETLEAVRRAREQGLDTLALSNTPSSPLEELADQAVVFPIAPQCGPDVSVLTTRLMMLYLLALHLGLRRGPRDDRLRELRAQLDSLPQKLERFLAQQEAAIEALASQHAERQAFSVVGGGANYFTALEGALKLEEEAGMLCKAYRPADYPHGALPLLGDSIATAVIAPSGPSYRRLRDALLAARAAGSPGIAVVLEEDGDIAALADAALALPGPLDEIMTPPLATVAFQVLGYYLGVRRGLNPDILGTDDMGRARAWLTAFPPGSH